MGIIHIDQRAVLACNLREASQRGAAAACRVHPVDDDNLALRSCAGAQLALQISRVVVRKAYQARSSLLGRAGAVHTDRVGPFIEQNDGLAAGEQRQQVKGNMGG